MRNKHSIVDSLDFTYRISVISGPTLQRFFLYVTLICKLHAKSKRRFYSEKKKIVVDRSVLGGISADISRTNNCYSRVFIIGLIGPRLFM